VSEANKAWIEDRDLPEDRLQNRALVGDGHTVKCLTYKVTKPW